MANTFCDFGLWVLRRVRLEMSIASAFHPVSIFLNNGFNKNRGLIKSGILFVCF